MPDTPATWLSQFTVNPTTTGSQSGQRIVNAGFLAGDQRDADIAALSGGEFVMDYQDSSASTSSIRLVERAADGSFLRSRTIDVDSTANASPSDFALRIAATGSGTFSQIEIVRGSAQADTLNATGSTASITLNGGAGNDTITGGLANDVLSGGNDADTINIGANAGNDTVTGGEGLTNDSDTLQFTGTSAGVNVTFSGNEAGTYSIGSGTGTFSQIETVQGTSQADNINASAATLAVTIGGGVGDDSMAGGSGSDVINLGTGADTVDGGAGNDIIDLGADAQNDLIIFADGDGQDRISNFTAPVFSAGIYTGRDLLKVSGLTDTAGRPVNVFDVVVSTDGSGHAVLTFPNGESLTLVGVPAASVSSVAQLMAMGIPGPDGTVQGTAGDDLIDGSYQGDPGGDRVDSNDAILAGHSGQDDLIVAGDGNDQVYADQGNDTVYGGTGNDQIFTGSGNDTAFGDAGNDVIDSYIGDDLLYGGANDDFLVGNVGADTLYGDAGNDVLFGGDDNDSLFGGANDDQLQGNLGNDSLSGGDGNDNLNGGENDDILAGDAGNDQLSGGDGNDIVNGGLGNDEVDGGAGNDVLSAGDGNDFVVGGSGDDTSFGDAGNDQINSGIGNDLTYGGAGEDLVFGEGGNDNVYGGDDRDTVYGGLGHDTIYGDAGNDYVSGRYGDDTAYGGTGDDEVFGDVDSSGTGARQFAIFGLGTSGNGGTQTVSGTFGFNAGGGITTLEVIDDDVNFNQSGGDSGVPQTLAYDITVGAQTFTSVSAIVMVSSTAIFNAATGLNGHAWLIQIGPNAADRFWTYDIPVANGDQITWSTVSTIGAVDYDQLVQADGSTTAIGNDVLYGGDGNDTVYGADGNDTLSGDADNDTVDGGTGHDRLFGGSGNDTLLGGEGNDTLTGDGGNDLVTGGDGVDRFVLGNGAGTDTITGGEVADAAGDTLDASGVTTNITLDLSGSNPETGTLTSTGIATSFTEIENVILGSGADSVIGSSGADHVSTGQGQDRVNGGAGNDVFGLGGTGTGDNAADLLVLQDGSDDDLISNFDAPIDNGNGTYTGVDTLDVSALHDGTGNPVNVADVVVSNDGSGNAVLTFPNGESITLIGVDPSEVANPKALIAMGIPGTDGTVSGTGGDDLIDGSYLGDPDGDRVDNVDAVLPGQSGNDDLIDAGAGNDTVLAGAGNDTVYGGTGNDGLFGGADNDTLSGGSGNDQLFGGTGADTLLVGLNEGIDTINGGTSGADIDTLQFTGSSGGASATFTGDDDGFFSAGTGSGTFDQIEAVTGTEQGDTINASATTQGISLSGGGGSDTLTGGSGNDALAGGTGDDWLSGGDGNDTLLADNATDLVQGDDTLVGGSGDDSLTSFGGTDSLYGGTGNDTLNNGEGSAILDGGTGNDVISAGSGNDTLFGGAGNDTLINRVAPVSIDGGAGNDLIQLYTLNATTASGTISGGGDIDSLDLSNWARAGLQTLTLTGIEVLATGGNTVTARAAQFDAFDTIRVDASSSTSPVTLILSATGAATTLNLSDELASGGPRAVVLTGSTDSETLTTGSGNDSVFSGAGNDTLNGGIGNDTMTGGIDNDVYIVNTAADRVIELASGGTADRIAASASYVLAAGVAVELMQTMSTAGTGAINLTGNAFAQRIFGNAGANRLEDGAGAADTMTGGLGNDTFVVRNAGTLIVEGVGQGTADSVAAAVSFVLAADDNVERMQTILTSGTGAINLTGNALGQSIFGNAGANRLDGKGGDDTLTGSLGADVFVFTSTLGVGNVDRITDYNVATDQIQIDNAVFVGLVAGALTGYAANATVTAVGTAAQIIYETDTGFLWFDANGTGAAGQTHFATLDTKLATLGASEFTVI